MKPVMQMRIGWSISDVEGTSMAANAYTTPYELIAFDPMKEGFGKIEVDLTPREAATQESGPVSVEEGLRLSQMLGCVACHSVKDKDLFKIGPKWNNLYGAERQYIDEQKKKGTVIADEAYLRESILQPAAKRHANFAKSEYAMPSYAGVVTDSQLESLVLYIKSLK
jgi:mono/diheme cytochrome c family protein